MPRYVDADKILAEEEKAFRRFFKQCRSTAVSVYIRSVHAAFQRIVRRAATIHVAPIIYGEWIEDEYAFNRCSICGYEMIEREYITPFCPHCGAKMKTDGDEGE